MQESRRTAPLSCFNIYLWHSHAHISRPLSPYLRSFMYFFPIFCETRKTGGNVTKQTASTCTGRYILSLQSAICTCIKWMRYIAEWLEHKVHIFVEMKQGQCICPLSWSVHCNFTGEGKCNERGWACTPHPHQPGPILPSSLNVRQKAAVATLCTLWVRASD
jgi:hypothetical protein